MSAIELAGQRVSPVLPLACANAGQAGRLSYRTGSWGEGLLFAFASHSSQAGSWKVPVLLARIGNYEPTHGVAVFCTSTQTTSPRELRQ